MNREITKIKLGKDGRVVINYAVLLDDDRRDEYTLSCTDAPTPEFAQTMGALSGALPAWLEVDAYYCSDMTPIGVSLTWKHGIMGACVTALKPLTRCNAPLVINTPHKSALPYSGTDDSMCLPGQAVEMLEKLIAHASDYIDGVRAQADLFVGAEEGME